MPGLTMGAEAAARRSDAGAHVGLLGDGAHPHSLLAELGDEAPQSAQGATDVEHLLVTPHLLPEGLGHRLGVSYLSHDISFSAFSFQL